MKIKFALLLSMMLVMGCRSSTTVVTKEVAHTEPSVESPRVVHLRNEADDLADLARQIQNASDSPAEAVALQRLHEYETGHKLTYNVKCVDTNLNKVVPNASVSGATMRADVAIYRGQIPIYNFSFIPRDNRNLTQLGQ